MPDKNNAIKTSLLPPRQGRIYQCGTMTDIFKADEEETDEKYSISEWWLDQFHEIWRTPAREQ